MTDENELIRRRYDAIPDIKKNYVGTGDGRAAIVAGAFLISMILGFALIPVHMDNIKNNYALEINSIRTDDLSCTELNDKTKTLSLKFDNHMLREIYKRMYDDDCITWAEHEKLKDELRCAVYYSLDCRINDLKEREQVLDNKHGKGR